MYGAKDRGYADNTVIRDEVSFTNLIQIANNPIIFSKLDAITQQQLIQILCAYTKGCVEAILKDDPQSLKYDDTRKDIQSRLK